MPKKTNLIINEAKLIKEGEGQYGPYKMWSIKFQGGKNKYTYFEKNNYAPMVGDMIDFVEWDESQNEKDGKVYTNYTIKTIMLSDKHLENTPQTASEPQQRDKKFDSSITMFISYAKDLMVAVMPFHPGYHQMELEDLGNIATQVGIQMYNKVYGKCDGCLNKCNEPDTDPIKMPPHPELENYMEEIPLPEEPPI